jgi:MFS family permease
MHVLVMIAAVVVALGAAVRSTWSPCGWSMLSTLTPLAERSRGRRWAATACWFTAGAVLGGALLGTVAAGLAALVGLLDLSSGVTAGIAAVAALAAAAVDAGLAGAGTRPPHHRRQVNEDWLDRYRSWVYGGGFGLQIGTGVSTYIMTTAVYLTVVLGALTGEPRFAFAVAVLFATTRGLAVWTSARLTSTDRLMAFHRRFDALGEPVRLGVIGLQVLVATALAAAAGGAVAGVAVLAVAAVVAGVRHRRPVAGASCALPTAERGVEVASLR